MKVATTSVDSGLEERSFLPDSSIAGLGILVALKKLPHTSLVRTRYESPILRELEIQRKAQPKREPRQDAHRQRANNWLQPAAEYQEHEHRRDGDENSTSHAVSPAKR